MNPVLKIILAMVIWGSIGIFVKNIDLPSVEIAFLRAIIASIFLILVRVLMKNKSPVKSINKHSRKDLILLFISGIILAFNWLFLFQAYKFTTVTNATLSYYSAPLFVILLSPIILKEKITIKKLLSVLVAMIGLAIIVSQQKQGSNTNYMHFKGIVYGISAAVLYANVILFNKKIKGFSSFDRTIVQIVVSAVVLLPIILYRNNLYISGLSMFITIMILGIVHTGTAYFLYFSSIEHVHVQRASILSYIDPISAVIFGTLFLSEPLGIFHIIGGVLILFSAFLCD